MSTPSSIASDNGNETPPLSNDALMEDGWMGSNSKTTERTDMPQENNSLKKTLNLEELEKLPYEIHRYSSFSTNYVPE